MVVSAVVSVDEPPVISGVKSLVVSVVISLNHWLYQWLYFYSQGYFLFDFPPLCSPTYVILNTNFYVIKSYSVSGKLFKLKST